MKIKVLNYTRNPIDTISLAAGCCYGKDDVKESRVRNCLNSKHMGVFEHASITVKIEGISRACSHQLVRHRLASFCQESQRYCRYDLTGEDWFVIPPDLENLSVYRKAMKEAGTNYMEALKHGHVPEDARYLLPEATKTNIVMTMNVRELFHFFSLRLDRAAQWEIRGMAEELLDTVSFIDYQWKKLMKMGTENGHLE